MIRQPVRGYRAATDPVLLAAAAPVADGDRVLDLGCGAGVAALCVGARVPGVVLAGLEVQAGYAGLARENAAANGVALDVHEGDLRAMPAALKAQSFDCVLMNPPWYPPDHSASPDPGRAAAHREDGASVADWVGAALARLRQRGWLVAIHRTERLPELLTALRGRAGAVTVLPLVARAGREAARVILRARKDVKTPFRLCPPLVLHQGMAHAHDGDDFTPGARRVLRDGAALEF